MVTIYEEKYPSHRSPVSRCILLMCLLTVLCGETESNCYLHTNSVTEPPPGRPHIPHTQLLKNLKVTAGHPGSRAEASRYFRGRRRASHMGVWGPIASTKCIRFINPIHTSSRRAITVRVANERTTAALSCSVPAPILRPGQARGTGSGGSSGCFRS